MSSCSFHLQSASRQALQRGVVWAVLQKEITMIVSDRSGFSGTGDKTCNNRLYCSDIAVMTVSAILLAVATAGLVVKMHKGYSCAGLQTDTLCQ